MSPNPCNPCNPWPYIAPTPREVPNLIPKGQLRRIAKHISEKLDRQIPNPDPETPVDIARYLPAGIKQPEELEVITERLGRLGWNCYSSVPLATGDVVHGGKEAKLERRREAAERIQTKLGGQLAVDLVAPRRRHVTLHIGPTNSGKTHHALQRLAASNKGLYLAPLRLLAWEAAERLNEGGCPTNLLTGEEFIPVEGARVIAATTEMFPQDVYEVVVVDEAQMVGDPDRGWAWLRALIQADTDELHVCAAPHAEEFLMRMFETLGDHVSVEHNERLVPLRPLPDAVPLDKLPERSAVVAFSRAEVLRLKGEIEEIHKKPCAVIYGALPPDVRREQARRVRSGECPYVVATDAIGMGINFPVDHVFLTEVSKYDGRTERPLRAEETLQIIGRAGRFGLSDAGWYGSTSRTNHQFLLETAVEKPLPVVSAYLQPTARQLGFFTGRLAKRLELWQEFAQPLLPDFIHIAPLEQMIDLARLLPPQLEDDLEQAYMLITAPVSRESLAYWQQIVNNLVQGKKAPGPGFPPEEIHSDTDLQQAESSLKQHELCLWLQRRGVPCRVGEHRIRRNRDAIAQAMNAALARGVSAGGCRVCGRKLPPGYRFRICGPCYERQTGRVDRGRLEPPIPNQPHADAEGPAPPV
ncbi:MAG TPA: helicase-related protein [Symbiobacteriaceae bacterium]|nr:helicase-related protein [Symbiobacteriaceae bacterium]